MKTKIIDGVEYALIEGARVTRIMTGATIAVESVDVYVPVHKLPAQLFPKPKIADVLTHGIKSYADIKVVRKQYTYVLGGDGRSQPYDEQRTGLVVEVHMKEDYMLAYETRPFIERMLLETYNADHVEVIHKFIKQ
jgi:hypothetical protein